MVAPRNAKQLTALLEDDIRTGRLDPGDRLEPVRPAAESLGLAPNTVAAAYRELARRGLVRSEGRRGTFVSAAPPLVGLTTPSPVAPVPAGLVDLAGGNPDPALLPPLAGALTEISTEHALYGGAQIDPTLADLLRIAVGADLPHLTPDGPAEIPLAVVGGALDGLERALVAHLRPGDAVAVEDPAYTSVLDLVAAMGLRAEPVTVDPGGLVPESLAAALDRVSAVIITPRAHNPTGAALDRDRADELAAVLAARPDLLVIEDDHAGPVAGVPYHSAIPCAAQRWAVVRSMAKSLGPDVRVAGLVGDETTVARVAGRQALGTGWVSHLLQRIVVALLTDPSTGHRLSEAAQRYRSRRIAFVDRLRAGGLQGPAATWLGCRSGLNVWIPVADEAQAVAGMQQRGFAIRSGGPIPHRLGARGPDLHRLDRGRRADRSGRRAARGTAGGDPGPGGVSRRSDPIVRQPLRQPFVWSRSGSAPILDPVGRGDGVTIGTANRRRTACTRAPTPRPLPTSRP